MPGKAHRFSRREDRQEKHIEASEIARGLSRSDASHIGWATVNSKHVKGKHRKGK